MVKQITLEIHRRGVSVLLVEQNARQALQVAHRAYLLETGKIVMEGPAAELAQDPKGQRGLLGSAGLNGRNASDAGHTKARWTQCWGLNNR